MAWQHAVSLAQLHARSLATSLRSSVFFLDGVFFGGIVVVGWWLVEVFCVWWLGVDHAPPSSNRRGNEELLQNSQ